MQKEEDRMRSLSDALRAVVVEDSALEASPAVEARLRAEVRALARPRRTMWIAVGSLAAAAVLAVAVTVPSMMRTAKDPGDAANPAGAERAAVEVATAFFPLDYGGMPVSNPQLVRLEVPRTALAAFGLTPIDVPGGGSPGTASGTVQADVVVGEDGVARAIRFVRTVGEELP